MSELNAIAKTICDDLKKHFDFIQMQSIDEPLKTIVNVDIPLQGRMEACHEAIGLLELYSSYLHDTLEYLMVEEDDDE